MTWSGREPSRRVPLLADGVTVVPSGVQSAPPVLLPGHGGGLEQGPPGGATGMGPGRSRLLLRRVGATAVPSGGLTIAPPSCPAWSFFVALCAFLRTCVSSVCAPACLRFFLFGPIGKWFHEKRRVSIHN